VVDYKGLRGDASDNIPGIRGIGEKTATSLLTTFGTLEQIYKKLEAPGGEEKFIAAGITKRIIGLLREGKEDAEFSKMLATIRTDALDSFDLASAEWRTHATVEEIQNLFSEFGFRNMTGRIERLFNVVLVDDSAEALKVEEGELQQAAIMLWLLESERTNATYEDIIDYGRSFLRVNTWQEIIAAMETRLQDEGLWDLYQHIELPLLPVLTAMKAQGIKLDVTYLHKLSKKLHTELSALEKNIYKHAGVEFNINSPKQLGEVLFDTLGLKPKNAKKTGSGQRSTKESELEKLQDEHPIIAKLLRYRELKKLVSTYIDNLPDMVGPDGRIHSTLLQTGTSTGRMASKDPNLQNIPIRTEEGKLVRGAFVAESGYQLVAIDYSQIELRIAAIMSEDKSMIEIFKNGEDVHSGVASRVFGVSEAEVTPDMRRKAKVINFGILYGMGVNALRTNLGEDTPRAEAQAFLNAYFTTFTRLAEFLEETKSFARETGYTQTMFGRRRHFAGISSSIPFIRAQAERMAINAPIQGTAADCMRIAMRHIYDYIQGLKTPDNVRMLLQVHDELVFEIKDSEVQKVVPELVHIMESALDGKESHGVPLVADVKVGENWNEMTELD